MTHPPSRIRIRSTALLVGVLAVLTHAASVGATRPDPAASRAKRRFVAVMELAPRGVDDAAANVLTEALGDELLRLKQFRMMERSQMQSILKEQGFQQSGSCDLSECAVEIGKVLGIDLMIVGTIGKLGGTYTISVRAVDVSTSEVVASSRRSVKGEIDDLLTLMVPQVSRELVSTIVEDPAIFPTSSLPPAPLDTLVDPRDDQRYPFARFGNLNWMTRNMNYRLSDFSSWCYEDAKGNCDYLGRLYNWEKATLACPSGWRLPTVADWNDLAASLGGAEKAGAALHGPIGGKDHTVFRARASGFRDSEGSYLGIGVFAIWWTATENDIQTAHASSLDFSGARLGSDPTQKSSGYSVRCVAPPR